MSDGVLNRIEQQLILLNENIVALKSSVENQQINVENVNIDNTSTILILEYILKSLNNPFVLELYQSVKSESGL